MAHMRSQKRPTSRGQSGPKRLKGAKKGKTPAIATKGQMSHLSQILSRYGQ